MLSHLSRKLKLKKPTLLQTILLLFVLPLASTAALIEYLNWKTEQQAVEQLVEQLQQGIGDRIQERIEDLTKAPIKATERTDRAIRRGELSTEDLDIWQNYLIDQGSFLEDLTFLYFANQTGDYVELDNQIPGVGQITRRAIAQPQKITRVNITSDNVETIQQTLDTPYDPRKRIWYQIAAEKGEPQWTEPYEVFLSGSSRQRYGQLPTTIAFSFVRPFFDSDNETLLGVIGADFTLADIDRFLQSISISKTGEAFIINREGQLIATSQLRPSTKPINMTDGELQDSEYSVFLQEELGNLENINRTQTLTVKEGSDRTAIRISPFSDEYSLDWLVVVVIPESDFTDAIRDRSRLTLLLTVAILGSVLLLATVMAHRLSYSVLKLSQASEAIAAGNLDQRVTGSAIRELDITAHAFNSMGQKLKQSYTQLEDHSKSLEKKVKERTKDLEIEIRERQQSEEAFKTLVSNVPGTVYRCRYSLDWNMLFLSESVIELCGYPASDFVNDRVRTFGEILFPGDSEATMKVVEKAVNNRKPYGVEYRLIHANGSIRWVYDQGKGIFDEQGDVLYIDGVFIDVTQQKQAKELLAQSETRYRSLFEDAPISIWEEDFSPVKAYLQSLDILETTEDFEQYFNSHPEVVLECIKRVEVIDVNQAALRLFEAQKKEDLLTRLTAHGDSTGRDGFARMLISHCQGKSIFEDELINYTLTGKKKNIIFKAFISPGYEEDWSRVLISIIDITARKQVEAQLATSEDKYRTLNELTQDAVMLLDAKHFIDCNPATLKIFGCRSKAEFIGRTPGDFSPKVQPDGRKSAPVVKQVIQNAFKLGTQQVEWYHQRLDGSLFPAEVWLTAMEIEGQQVVQAVIRDITARKQAEAEIIQAKEAAEIANKAKSTFLANMSHELRSPLNAVLGFAQIMGQSQSLPLEHRADVDIISRSGEHLLGLINDVLDMAKIEAGRTVLAPTAFNLLRLIQDLQNMFRLRAQEKQLELAVEYLSEVPQHVIGDQGKLKQILINLINNAIKFTNRGSVTLKVAVKDIKNNDIRLQFSVIDTGIGISPDEIETVLEPFVQSQSGIDSQEGTGLGLAISRKFIQLMGGELNMTSQVSGQKRGTAVEFDVCLQVADKALEPTPQKSREVIAIAAGESQYKILVVDDKTANGQLLLRLLAPVGFEVEIVNNGQSAIDKTLTWQPHLIFMDLRMPNMSGIEATQRIRQQSQRQQSQHGPTIIALSATGFRTEQENALKAGCDDFIRKPFQTNEIFEVIAQYLGVRYRYANESTHSLNPSEHTSKAPAEISSAALSSLPLDLLTQLETAALKLQWQQLLAIIEEVRTQDSELAHALQSTVEDFHYRNIIQSVQETKATL